MSAFWDSIGSSAANSLGGAVANLGINQLGYALGNWTGYNKALEEDQVRQQQKLTNIQYAANSNLMKQSYEQQLDMWNKTNYEAQIAHLKNAGLNPALMYAKGGAGGTTGGGGASVGGSNASDVASMKIAQTQQQMQGMAMMKLSSEIKLNEAQAEKLKADANLANSNTETVEATRDAIVNQINTNIDNLKADTSLKGEQSNLIKLQEDTAKIANEYNAENNTTMLKQNLQILRNMTAQANVSEATQNSLIELAKQNVKLSASQILLNNSNIQLNDMEKKLISAKIGEIMNSIVISQGQLKVNQATLTQALEIEKMRLSGGSIVNQIRGVSTLIRNAITNTLDYSW